MVISGAEIQIYVSPSSAFIRPAHFTDEKTYVIDSAWPVSSVCVYISRERLAEILFKD